MKKDTLFLAIDGRGNKIFACEAYDILNRTGEKVKGLVCPHCGCLVELTHYGDTYYFRHKSDPNFHASDCYLQKHGMRDLEHTDPHKMLKNICSPKPTAGGGTPGKGGGRERKGKQFFRKCTALEHIDEYGLRFEKDWKRLRKYHALELLMTPILAPCTMPLNNGSLGLRAVYLRPHAADDKNLSIQFFFYWAVDAGHKKKKSFVLAFGESYADDYKKWKAELFDAQGNPKVKEVLVAAEWVESSHEDCLFVWCAEPTCTYNEVDIKWVCTGSQKGYYRSDEQILFVRHNKNDNADI